MLVNQNLVRDVCCHSSSFTALQILGVPSQAPNALGCPLVSRSFSDIPHKVCSSSIITG